jgi:hypothetical protein
VTLLVSAASVREYMALNATASTSQYTDATIGSNILAAQSMLETATGRWFVDRPSVTWAATSMLRAQVYIPGFRSFTSVSWGGSDLTVALPGDTSGNGSVWALQDPLGTGVYIGLQFRAFRADANGRPWWLADSQWYDKALDSPFYPGNYGGGYFWSSMPNDLVVIGDGGYATNLVPATALHAIKVLAAFYTMRPASILADVAITPQGGVLTYSQLPNEVAAFITQWRLGEQIVSVG